MFKEFTLDELKKTHDYLLNMVKKYGYGVSETSNHDKLIIIKNKYIKRLRSFDMTYYRSHQEHSLEGPTWFVYRDDFYEYSDYILNYYGENDSVFTWKDDKPSIQNGKKYIMSWKWYNDTTHESHDILEWCEKNNIDPLYPSDTERFLIKMHCLSLNG